LRSCTLLLFLVSLIGAFPVTSVATESVTTGPCSYVFRVGLIFSEPLYFVSGQRKLGGISLEVIKELRKRTGCDFTVEEYSRPSLVERFRHQQLDMSIVSIKTAAMDGVGEFIHLFNTPRRFIVRSFAAQDLKSALKNKKIIFGNIMGTQTYYTNDEIKLLRKDKRLVEFPDYDALFSSFKRGKIQAYIGSLMMSSYYIKKLKLNDFALSEDEINLIPVGYYVNKTRLKRPELLILNKALAQMLKDGTFIRIYAEYTSDDIAKKSILLIGQ
jgi:polar amino acid transport system substrate-binding protein